MQTILKTANAEIKFDRKKGHMESFACNGAELLVGGPDDAMFTIEFLEEDGSFSYVDSCDCKAAYAGGGERHGWVYEADGLSVKTGVRSEGEEALFSLEVENNTGKRIVQILYPYVVLPFDKQAHVLQPYNIGYLFDGPQPQHFRPDCHHAWQFVEENGAFHHYPGRTIAQLMAYYNDRAGLLVMAKDNTGQVKQIMPVSAPNGVRLGFSHVGDRTQSGKIEYDMCLRGFTGDWYDAAKLYRDWSDVQVWAKPLHARKDLPKWIADSPTFLMIRLQGALDAGPAPLNKGFVPYEGLTEKIEALQAKAPGAYLPALMGWEKGGPWVYPDYAPPVGGNNGMASFSKQQKERGNHVGSYSNGTRWVTGHYWNGYDGTAFYEEKNGRQSVCETSLRQPWKQDWDIAWRPSYTCCIQAEQTHQLAEEYIRTLISNGLDWIQFLDQNNGCASFPCFSKNHGHEQGPGYWMTQGMERLFAMMGRLKKDAEAEGREIVYSVEGPSCEYFIPQLDVCDARVNPHGNPNVDGEESQVPLYQFLYHDYILLNGGFGFGPEPYHMEIKNALNLTAGQMPGAVLMDDGNMQNQNSSNWTTWGEQPGSQKAAVDMLNTANTMRRQPAKDFLVYGKMQRPAEVKGIAQINWQYGKQNNTIPAVFHSAWTAPDGRKGIVLANWTGEDQTVSIGDEWVQEGRINAACVRGLDISSAQGGAEWTVPARGAVLVEQAK